MPDQLSELDWEALDLMQADELAVWVLHNVVDRVTPIRRLRQDNGIFLER